MLKHYRMFAAYNQWANTLLYDAAAELTDAEFHENRGAFFGSLCGTLNHLLVADRIWMHRFTGDVAAAPRLDGASYHDLGELRVERQAEDQRIVGWIDTLGDSTALAREISFSPVTQPGAVTLSLTTALANFFNHQTHHRGQCHMTLTALGKPSLAIDVIHFLRSEGKAWM